MSRETASVLVPVPVDEPFDYAVPDGTAVPPPGSFVGVPHGMAKAGLLEPVGLVEVDVPPPPDPDAPGVTLTPDQARVAAGLVAAVTERRPEVVLLEGVPGAGKTEVYFEAVAEALRH